jgi:hypothetical protein
MELSRRDPTMLQYRAEIDIVYALRENNLWRWHRVVRVDKVKETVIGDPARERARPAPAHGIPAHVWNLWSRRKPADDAGHYAETLRTGRTALIAVVEQHLKAETHAQNWHTICRNGAEGVVETQFS